MSDFNIAVDELDREIDKAIDEIVDLKRDLQELVKALIAASDIIAQSPHKNIRDLADSFIELADKHSV